MTTIVQTESSDQIAVAQALFREYEAWLAVDLCFQGFEEELAGLPGKYAPPNGRLFLAYLDKAAAGCIAMRKMDDRVCEMKRLFVRDGFRGQKVGNALIETLIAEARLIGYRKMRLDTFPAKMSEAVRLYKAHGFEQISPYYHNPNESVLFMELEL